MFPINLDGLLQQFKQDVARAIQELQTVQVTGTDPGGHVTVVANGLLDVRSVHLSPQFFYTGQLTAEQSALAAVQDALAKARQVAKARVKEVSKGLPIDLSELI